MSDKLSEELLRETSFDELPSGFSPPNTPPAYNDGPSVSPLPTSQVVHVVEPVHIHPAPMDPDPIPRKRRSGCSRFCIIPILVVLVIILLVLAVVFMVFCFTGEHCFQKAVVNKVQDEGGLPGQYQGPNDQCIQLFGKESYYCGVGTCP